MNALMRRMAKCLASIASGIDRSSESDVLLGSNHSSGSDRS